MDKVLVNGPDANEVFKWLRSNTKELQSRKRPGQILELPWNFCRWVVDRQGKIQMYMNPTIQLHTCYELVEHLLELNKKPKQRMLFSSKLSLELADKKLVAEP